MKLQDHLVTIKPREESGSKTSGKYDFQKDLSLYILCQRHPKSTDYVFLFDFHDDLVIADSSINPTELEFYQIKTKEGKNKWTITSLIKPEASGLSILGKLYLNKINFDGNTKSLNFISNQHFSFKRLKDGAESPTKTQISAIELNESDLESCINEIKTEHSLTSCDDFTDLTNFYVTNLSITDSSTHCIGALQRLINIINPSNKINSELAYEQVINEVKRKTKNTLSDKSLKSFEQLIELKGITRKEFLSFLEKAGLYKSIEQEWSDVQSELQRSGLGYLEVINFKAAWREVAARLIRDPNNVPLQQLKHTIVELIEVKKDSGQINSSQKLISIVEEVYSGLTYSIPLYSEYFIKCLIIKVLYGE